MEVDTRTCKTYIRIDGSGLQAGGCKGIRHVVGYLSVDEEILENSKVLSMIFGSDPEVYSHLDAKYYLLDSVSLPLSLYRHKKVESGYEQSRPGKPPNEQPNCNPTVYRPVTRTPTQCRN